MQVFFFSLDMAAFMVQTLPHKGYLLEWQTLFITGECGRGSSYFHRDTMYVRYKYYEASNNFNRLLDHRGEP